VGIDHDTARFAVRTIGQGGREWGGLATGGRAQCSSLRTPGKQWRTRAPVEVELQQLANRTGLRMTVCHLPPGTSKWNKIEHRLFSYISTNWRGQPLVSLAVIVNLIGSTRTAAGLRVRCELDRGAYPKGQEVTDAQMAQLKLVPHRFHGDWNYTLHPTRRRQ
jgi:Rhodopirellula transposase DDE domain